MLSSLAYAVDIEAFPVIRPREVHDLDLSCLIYRLGIIIGLTSQRCFQEQLSVSR